MRADGSRDKGQRIFFADDCERFRVPAFADKIQIGGNILMNGTALLTGSGETIQEGNPAFQLAVGLGLGRLDVARVQRRAPTQGGKLFKVDAVKGVIGLSGQRPRNGLQAVVAAGL